jgi:hypothetical protein
LNGRKNIPLREKILKKSNRYLSREKIYREKEKNRAAGTRKYSPGKSKDSNSDE